MKILTWNINGIRASRGKSSAKSLLDSLCADIICLQETKITRDMLDEPTAIIDGYESYFSFSRKRSGYSGTANYCKKTASPNKAEEGLTGKCSNHSETTVGCYGNMESYSDNDLEALDAEGRCVITQHKIRLPTSEVKDVAIINVYVPRAGEKEDRLHYKLKFLSVLQSRCEALLKHNIHVILVGDMNLTHQKLDNCESIYDEDFLRLPSRIWFNEMLQESEHDPSIPCVDSCLNEFTLPDREGGHFSDIFRRLHPDEENAYTNWHTTTEHRKTNYGRRLDYILVDTELAKFATDCQILSQVEGSDHCPVIMSLNCEPVPSTVSPQHCSKFMPEFKGQQQKLSSFFIKATTKDINDGSIANSQSETCVTDILTVDEDSDSTSTPKSVSSEAETNKVLPSVHPSAKLSVKRQTCEPQKSSKKLKPDPSTNKQVSLTSFFITSNPSVSHTLSASKQNNVKSTNSLTKQNCTQSDSDSPTNSQASLLSGSSDAKSTKNTTINQAWRTLLKGPAPPPLCPGHHEPCILKTVTKKGPNKNKQFYVCSRPDGAPGNPEHRCNFFQWLGDNQKKHSK
ncbi:DNA-(apurinic or apyrimidinic site) endonuclease 2-like [Biomphalaria glabrata]|uniref:DNA-(apurinic or apyrimidinic site) endonuclease n=1 Tax=Biomphalaria glabrata TaxID=6526 RepID=A0A9W3A4R1_BIOGL|nr:DNA-(apurinic or apyrimidinic site) endonuclease 2-like [Biomphalaria glabrata]XP_055882292.1 DNA-(apurinic or apyrimidinic site) endonuclease 2-like [Biomphalaria glabrata]XP_055882293.1 DNA-(apurinic or apyrimidinic site) endonuclease 2-like [Biomphalaria glabrata]XP_055882294.1 DNA-(apurinic or apyrimidinic site) endonuclease 2-like [Biomphalaria glabrata]